MLRQLLRTPTLTKIQRVRSIEFNRLPDISALWVPSDISIDVENDISIIDIQNHNNIYSYGNFYENICIGQRVFDLNENFIATVCRTNSWDKLVRFSKFYKDADCHTIAFEVSGVPMYQYSSLGFDAIIVDGDEKIKTEYLLRDEPQNPRLQELL